jgi:hypothetical protein
VVLGWLFFLSVGYVFTRLYIYLYEHWVTWRGTRQKLRQQLQDARSYEQWIQGAKELDSYLGNDSWKEKDDYAYYDSKTVKRVSQQMVKLRQKAEAQEHISSGAKGTHPAVEDLRALMEGE